MKPLKIAVIGSGISGLSAAWLLSGNHQVTLYEADGHFGGHANTVDVETPSGRVAVDTGFIVYNERNYPNLVELFERLEVPTSASEMTFALSIANGRYEYSGSGANGFFGQRRNLFCLPHWRMLGDITRFFRDAQTRLEGYAPGISLGDYLDAESYCDQFVNEHIVPMGAAIWSTDMRGMMRHPARAFIDFYDNHGLLSFLNRPRWRTVSGGSRSYVSRLLADAGVELKRANGVERIARHPDYVHVAEHSGAVRPFDHVVVATHADQALRLIEEPTVRERNLLGAFGYQENRAVLHRDCRFMPRRRRLWSSWNYLKTGEGVDASLCVTYWMNRLQELDTDTNLFVTLNPVSPIHPKAIDREITYDHPVFDAAAHDAQKDLWSLQGEKRTWFCGAYFGHGFHEDGAASGLAVAEALGGAARPWSTEGLPSRIPSWPYPSVAAAE